MNNDADTMKKHFFEDKDKEKEILKITNNDKGDIDDYIFSCQTVKMFSER